MAGVPTPKKTDIPTSLFEKPTRTRGDQLQKRPAHLQDMPPSLFRGSFAGICQASVPGDFVLKPPKPRRGSAWRADDGRALPRLCLRWGAGPGASASDQRPSERCTPKGGGATRDAAQERDAKSIPGMQTFASPPPKKERRESNEKGWFCPTRGLQGFKKRLTGLKPWQLGNLECLALWMGAKSGNRAVARNHGKER